MRSLWLVRLAVSALRAPSAYVCLIMNISNEILSHIGVIEQLKEKKFPIRKQR